MHRSIGAAAGLTAALTTAASASVIPDMSLGEVYRASDTVVHGKIVAQESRLEKTDGGPIIFTYNTVEVFSSAKGKADRLMTVRTVGGSVDGYNQMLIGEADISGDEEVVLFLATTERGKSPMVTGLYNGKFGVEIDMDGAVQLVSNSGAGAAGTGLAKRVPMDHFLNELSAAEQPGQRRGVGIETHDHGTMFRPTADLDANEDLAAFNRSLTRGVANADVNADGQIDIDDLSTISTAVGTDNADADVNADGVVDAADIEQVIETLSDSK